jgi:hypothetical protein
LAKELKIMDENHLKILSQFKSRDRFLLYWISCRKGTLDKELLNLQLVGIPTLNVGYELGQFLHAPREKFEISWETREYLIKSFGEKAKSFLEVPFPILAIYNLGILWESDLCITVDSFLKEMSKTMGIVFLWEEKMDESIFYWKTKESAMRMNFQNTNIKQIRTDDEI